MSSTLNFPAKDFIDVFSIISDLASQLDSVKIDPNRFVPLDQKETIRQVLLRARGLSNDLSLDVSVCLVDEILEQMASDYTVQSLKRALMGLKSRIAHEIEISPLVLRIRREKVKYFSGEAPFENNVSSRFPAASYDIEEASKCFALGRFSACVMHLQKVVEAGLRAFASWAKLSGVIGELELKNPNWGNILGPIREEIFRRNKQNDWPSLESRHFCENVRPFLESVKTAWRNPSMHFGSQYTEEGAEDIYFAVRGFMRFLSANLDENGTFRQMNDA